MNALSLPEGDLLTVRETAQFLGISPSAVRELSTMGELVGPRYKLRGHKERTPRILTLSAIDYFASHTPAIPEPIALQLAAAVISRLRTPRRRAPCRGARAGTHGEAVISMALQASFLPLAKAMQTGAAPSRKPRPDFPNLCHFFPNRAAGYFARPRIGPHSE